MKKLILITIVVVACIACINMNNNKTDYKELSWAMDLTVDRCTIDMINNPNIECD